MNNVPEEVKIITNDLINVCTDLQEYKKLFLKGENHTKLLNEISGYFFSRIQRFYWNHFVLSISKFTDPVGHDDFENLSLDRLKSIAFELNIDIIDELESIISKLKKKTKKIKSHRNKYVSHRDLKTAKLKEPNRNIIHINDVEEVLDLIGKAINLFYEKLEKRQYYWKAEVPGVDFLWVYLKNGAIYLERLNRDEDWLKEDKDLKESSYNW